MKACPDIRASRPRKWWWLANVIPCVQVWAHQVHVGFWCHTRTRLNWNPTMRRPCLAVTPHGVRILRGPN